MRTDSEQDTFASDACISSCCSGIGCAEAAIDVLTSAALTLGGTFLVHHIWANVTLLISSPSCWIQKVFAVCLEAFEDVPACH